MADPYSDFASLDQLAEDLRRQREGKEIDAVAEDLHSTYLWVLCAIGLPANVIIIVTIVSMRLWSPATIFIALLAFCDGTAITAKLIGSEIKIFGDSQGDILCKLQFFPSWFSAEANWVLVLICVERFISVYYPLHKKVLLTKRRALIVAGSLTLFLFIFYATVFCIMRVAIRLPTYQGCTYSMTYADFWEDWWTWISVSLYLFLPFLLIIIFTLPIIRTLFVSGRHRRSMVLKTSATGTPSPADVRMLREAERTERMITIMLIVAAVVFLALCLPQCVYHIMVIQTYFSFDEAIEEAKFRLFKEISYLLADASHAVNFFLYFFTAKRFRSYAFKLFCRCCKHREHHTVCEAGSSKLTDSTGLSSPTSPSPRPGTPNFQLEQENKL